jgi:hypothetical protein
MFDVKSSAQMLYQNKQNGNCSQQVEIGGETFFHAGNSCESGASQGRIS